MLPLSPFTLSSPKNIDELMPLLRTMDSATKFLAGGTDLLPNCKHGIYDVRHLISLRNLKECRFVDVSTDSLKLGAMMRLNDITHHHDIARRAPALARASAAIASPQIRNMGTVGGNICLDTRCLYINQTEFWRASLGYCLKKNGCACHVVTTGKRCVAAASNDLATVLLAYNASITVLGNDTMSTMKLDDFYTANGEKNNVLPMGHVVLDVECQLTNAVAGFYKVRMRDSIDFALLSVAVHFVVDNGIFYGGRIVVNALVAKPKCIDLAQFTNLRYNHELVTAIADFAYKKCHPQTNIIGDVGFRKHMVRVAVKRAFHDAMEVR